MFIILVDIAGDVLSELREFLGQGSIGALLRESKVYNLRDLGLQFGLDIEVNLLVNSGDELILVQITNRRLAIDETGLEGEIRTTLGLGEGRLELLALGGIQTRQALELLFGGPTLGLGLALLVHGVV